MENINIDRFERRIVFVVREFSRYNIDMVVFFEIRWVGEG